MALLIRFWGHQGSLDHTWRPDALGKMEAQADAEIESGSLWCQGMVPVMPVLRVWDSIRTCVFMQTSLTAPRGPTQTQLGGTRCAQSVGMWEITRRISSITKKIEW